MKQECPACYGAGAVQTNLPDPCWLCDGWGHVEDNEPCCTYRDHGSNLGCACPDEKHVGDPEHPFAQNVPWA